MSDSKTSREDRLLYAVCTLCVERWRCLLGTLMSSLALWRVCLNGPLGLGDLIRSFWYPIRTQISIPSTDCYGLAKRLQIIEQRGA